MAVCVLSPINVEERMQADLKLQRLFGSDVEAF